MNFEKLAEEEWSVQGFNAVPLLLDHAGDSATKKTWDATGQGHEYTLNQYENDYCEMYYHVPSLKRIYEYLIKEQQDNQDFLAGLVAQSKKEIARVHEFLGKIDGTDLEKLSDREFVKLFKETLHQYSMTVATGHLIEGFSLNADHDIKELLFRQLKQVGRENMFNKYFTMLTTPTKQSMLTQEENEIIGIAREIDEDAELRQLFQTDSHSVLRQCPNLKVMLKKHAEKYCWVAASYAAAPFAGTGYFVRKIQQLLAEGLDEQDDSISVQQHHELLQELRIAGKLRLLIEMANTITIWQDERKAGMLRCTCYVDMLAEHAAQRFGFSHQDARYLVPNDLSQGRLRGMKGELAQRREGCTILCTRKEQIVFTGETHGKLKEILHEESHEQLKEIPGTCASIGKAVGKVQICKSHEDIENFQEGNILVTIMTRPEFVPAMKKAAAIVTDEGGITSHAAIISREMKKPCLIGTKNATKLLRNGDLVEVKSNHSVLRIIERAEE